MKGSLRYIFRQKLIFGQFSTKGITVPWWEGSFSKKTHGFKFAILHWDTLYIRQNLQNSKNGLILNPNSNWKEKSSQTFFFQNFLLVSKKGLFNGAGDPHGERVLFLRTMYTWESLEWMSPTSTQHYYCHTSQPSSCSDQCTQCSIFLVFIPTF